MAIAQSETQTRQNKHPKLMKLPDGLTLETVLEAVERSHTTTDNPGFCMACGAEADGVEPDARKYTCEECGAQAVYGAEQLLLMFA